MANPPSGMKITKNGVTFVSNVERTKYTLRELSRAALRDVGRYIVSKTRKASRIRNHMSSYVMKHLFYGVDGAFSWWVRKKETDLQVGIKHYTWYGVLQELDDGIRPPPKPPDPTRRRKIRVNLNTDGKKKKKRKKKKQPIGHQILTTAVKENIDEIRIIEGHYLSAIEDENRALALIDEGEMQPNDNEQTDRD